VYLLSVCITVFFSFFVCSFFVMLSNFSMNKVDYKFPTGEIMSAHNFNFAFKFSKIEFSVQDFVS